MKVKLPFSPRLEDSFFSYLVTIYGYSVPDALRIVDYINSHPGDFIVFRKYRKINLRRVVIWVVQYRDDIILVDKLLKFIEDDCLPF